MFARLFQLCSVVLLACALTTSPPVIALAGTDGIVRVKSAYPMGETIERLKKDIAETLKRALSPLLRRSRNTHSTLEGKLLTVSITEIHGAKRVSIWE